MWILMNKGNNSTLVSKMEILESFCPKSAAQNLGLVSLDPFTETLLYPHAPNCSVVRPRRSSLMT
jgi:hypothetical protein